MNDFTVPTMLTIKETASRAGLAQHYVRQLCIERRIVCHRAGNKYIVNWEKFVEFLNRDENSSQN